MVTVKTANINATASTSTCTGGKLYIPTYMYMHVLVHTHKHTQACVCACVYMCIQLFHQIDLHVSHDLEVTQTIQLIGTCTSIVTHRSKQRSCTCTV